MPRVQYIDKVADIPVDVKRQGSTNEDPQHDIDEVGHVPVPTQSASPTIPDTDDLCLDEIADEDRLEQESKKRKLPTPAEENSMHDLDDTEFQDCNRLHADLELRVSPEQTGVRRTREEGSPDVNKKTDRSRAAKRQPEDVRPSLGGDVDGYGENPKQIAWKVFTLDN